MKLKSTLTLFGILCHIAAAIIYFEKWEILGLAALLFMAFVPIGINLKIQKECKSRSTKKFIIALNILYVCWSILGYGAGIMNRTNRHAHYFFLIVPIFATPVLIIGWISAYFINRKTA
jgi:hypothetical protein